MPSYTVTCDGCRKHHIDPDEQGRVSIYEMIEHEQNPDHEVSWVVIDHKNYYG